jgi:hypothetical protein
VDITGIRGWNKCMTETAKHSTVVANRDIYHVASEMGVISIHKVANASTYFNLSIVDIDVLFKSP